jgi:hypothetical protein
MLDEGYVKSRTCPGASRRRANLWVTAANEREKSGKNAVLPAELARWPSPLYPCGPILHNYWSNPWVGKVHQANPER